MCRLVCILIFFMCMRGVKAVFLAFDDPLVVREAEYALMSLAKLSDTDIYYSLSLSRVLEASQESGIFHDNTILKLELSSPHFKSGALTEIFDFVVMTHREDGVKSFAIDEFPIMDEIAAEEFWVKKVDKHRRVKEEAFRKLEIEAVKITQEGEMRERETSEHICTIELLLDELDSPEHKELRLTSSMERLKSSLGDKNLHSDEQILAQSSLSDLYIMSTSDDTRISEYCRERAKGILDEFFASLK
jgi:hypothetical protein